MSRTAGFAIGGTAVEEQLRARPARPGLPHRPEVVLTHALDPRGGDTGGLHPDLLGLVVVVVHRDPQPLCVEPEHLGQQFPGKRDGTRLEVVAEAEVPEHLEERAVALVVPDDVDVHGAKALLDRSRPIPRGGLVPQEVRLEGHHAGDREEDRRVVGDQAGRRHDHVTPLGIEAPEGGTQLVSAGHDGRSYRGGPTGPALVVAPVALQRARARTSSSCQSLSSRRRASSRPPSTARRTLRAARLAPRFTMPTTLVVTSPLRIRSATVSTRRRAHTDAPAPSAAPTPSQIARLLTESPPCASAKVTTMDARILRRFTPASGLDARGGARRRTQPPRARGEEPPKGTSSTRPKRENPDHGIGKSTVREARGRVDGSAHRLGRGQHVAHPQHLGGSLVDDDARVMHERHGLVAQVSDHITKLAKAPTENQHDPERRQSPSAADRSCDERCHVLGRHGKPCYPCALSTA